MSSLRDALASMPNPLSAAAVNAQDGAAVDVSELHGDARQAFVRGLVRARRGYPHLLVLLGEAGAGKSHLMWWLRQQHQLSDAEFAVCVALPALQDLAQPFRHALRHLVAALCKREESSAPAPPLERPIDVLLWQTLFAQACDLLDAARVGTYQGPAALMKTLGPLCLDAGRARPLRAFAEEAGKVWAQVEPGLRSYLLSLPTEMSIDSTARAVAMQFPYEDRRALVTSWLAGEDLSPKDRERLGAKQIINNESAAKYVLTSLVRLMAAAGAQLTLIFDQAEQTIEQLKQPGLQAMAEVISAVQASGSGALQILSCRPATWQKLTDKPARSGPPQLKQVDQVVQLKRAEPELLRELVAARLGAAFGDDVPRPGVLYPFAEADLSFLNETDTPRAALEALAQRFEERRTEATGAAPKARAKDAPSRPNLAGGSGKTAQSTGRDGPSRPGAKPGTDEGPKLKSSSGRVVVPIPPFLADSSPTLRALAEKEKKLSQAALAEGSGTPPKPATPFEADSSPTHEAVVAEDPRKSQPEARISGIKPPAEDGENPTMAMSQEMLEAALDQSELGRAARTSGVQSARQSTPAMGLAAGSKPSPAAKPSASKLTPTPSKPSAAVLKPVALKPIDAGDNPTMSMTDEALQRALGADAGQVMKAVAPVAPIKAKPVAGLSKPSAVLLKPVTTRPTDAGDNPTMSMSDEALQRALGADVGQVMKAVAPIAPIKAKPSAKPSAAALKPVSMRPAEDDNNPTMSMTDEALQRALGSDIDPAIVGKPATAAKPTPAASKPSAAPAKPAAAAKPAPKERSSSENDNPTMAMSQEMLLAALQSVEAAMDTADVTEIQRVKPESAAPAFVADSNPTLKQAPDDKLLRDAERSSPSAVRGKEASVRVKPVATKPSQVPAQGKPGANEPQPMRAKSPSSAIPATSVKPPAASAVPEPLPESASTPSQGWLAMADDPLASAVAKAKADLKLGDSAKAKPAERKSQVPVRSSGAANAGSFKPIPVTGVKAPAAGAVPEPLSESASTPSQGWLAMADSDPLADAVAQAKADLKMGDKSGPRSTQAKLPALQMQARGTQSATPQQVLGALGSRGMLEDWQLAEQLGVLLAGLEPVLQRMQEEGQIRLMPRGDTRMVVRV